MSVYLEKASVLSLKKKKGITSVLVIAACIKSFRGKILINNSNAISPLKFFFFVSRSYSTMHKLFEPVC